MKNKVNEVAILTNESFSKLSGEIDMLTTKQEKIDKECEKILVIDGKIKMKVSNNTLEIKTIKEHIFKLQESARLLTALQST